MQYVYILINPFYKLNGSKLWQIYIYPSVYLILLHFKWF